MIEIDPQSALLLDIWEFLKKGMPLLLVVVVALVLVLRWWRGRPTESGHDDDELPAR